MAPSAASQAGIAMLSHACNARFVNAAAIRSKSALFWITRDRFTWVPLDGDTRHHQSICGRALFGQSHADSKNDYRDLKGSKRDDYDYQDADDYFNCMGILAAEGTYDRLEEWLEAGVAPIDMILMMACSESDVPKVEELLLAGANPHVKDPRNGTTLLDLCSDDNVQSLLTSQ